MQDTKIGCNTNLNYVIIDKDVKIQDGRSLMGYDSYPVYISKKICSLMEGKNQMSNFIIAHLKANPFCGSGGLADVAGSLPHTLCRKGQDCRIVVPLYGTIPQELRNSLKFHYKLYRTCCMASSVIADFSGQDGTTVHIISLTMNTISSVVHFTVTMTMPRDLHSSQEQFFEMTPYIDFHPDMIHCNDWQTALVPVYYYLFYSHRPWYHNIKSLFTIHNIQYQGEYGWEVNTECVGIPANETKILEMNGKLNMMKGAIETATRVSTVSPSYAAEIKDPWFSWGLHDELNLRHYKLCGIKNGIDTESYNPETDYQIYRNYSKDDMSGKGECKRALQERLCLEQRWDVTNGWYGNKTCRS